MRRLGRSARSERGITLPEIMIAVVIVLFLSSMAFPKIRQMSDHSDLMAAAEHFAAELNQIRTEAVKRNAPIAVTFEPPDGYTAEGLGTRRLNRAVFHSAPESVRFGPFGPPLSGQATFVLAAGEYRKTVVLTGAGLAQVE